MKLIFFTVRVNAQLEVYKALCYTRLSETMWGKFNDWLQSVVYLSSTIFHSIPWLCSPFGFFSWFLLDWSSRISTNSPPTIACQSFTIKKNIHRTTRKAGRSWENDDNGNNIHILILSGWYSKAVNFFLNFIIFFFTEIDTLVSNIKKTNKQQVKNDEFQYKHFIL